MPGSNPLGRKPDREPQPEPIQMPDTTPTQVKAKKRVYDEIASLFKTLDLKKAFD